MFKPWKQAAKGSSRYRSWSVIPSESCSGFVLNAAWGPKPSDLRAGTILGAGECAGVEVAKARATSEGLIGRKARGDNGAPAEPG
jgi:hypothetical protein